MIDEKCHLQNYCGRFYDANGVAQCWCYSCDGSRRRVKELKEDIQRWENYIAALEDLCTPEQLREARKAAGNT